MTDQLGRIKLSEVRLNLTSERRSEFRPDSHMKPTPVGLDVLTEPSSIRVTDLRTGTLATLCDAQVDEETRSLLRSLGLTDSCKLRLCKRGEPCILQVRTTRIGVSQGVAERLFVLADKA